MKVLHASQVGCEEEEKDRFWNELDDIAQILPKEERMVVGADSNGDSGKGSKGDEEFVGKYDNKERNFGRTENDRICKKQST